MRYKNDWIITYKLSCVKPQQTARIRLSLETECMMFSIRPLMNSFIDPVLWFRMAFKLNKAMFNKRHAEKKETEVRKWHKSHIVSVLTQNPHGSIHNCAWSGRKYILRNSYLQKVFLVSLAIAKMTARTVLSGYSFWYIRSTCFNFYFSFVFSFFSQRDLEHTLFTLTFQRCGSKYDNEPEELDLLSRSTYSTQESIIISWGIFGVDYVTRSSFSDCVCLMVT